MSDLHSSDQVRYDALCSIIDQVKMDERNEDTDVYASAAQSLFWPEINKLRQEQISEKIRDAIQAVVQYGWADERRDFEQMQFEQDEKPGEEWHIFQRLVTLDNFLNGTSHAAEDHIETLD